jgi:hypothetical protein
MRPRRHIGQGLLLSLAPYLGACAWAIDTSVAPALDPGNSAAFEARAEVGPSFGSEDVRGYLKVGGGAGYSGGLSQGYGLVAPEAGLEFGFEFRGHLGVEYAPRFLEDGKARNALGAVAGLLFNVGPIESGLFIGPRVQIEHHWGAERDSGLWLSLPFVFRWVMFDSMVWGRR